MCCIAVPTIIFIIFLKLQDHVDINENNYNFDSVCFWSSLMHGSIYYYFDIVGV